MINGTQIDETSQFLVRSAAFAWKKRIRYWTGSALLTVVVVGIAVTVVAQGQDYTNDRVKYAWVQMLPDNVEPPNGRLVRAIVAGGAECPPVRVAGEDRAMDKRRPAVAAAFPILLCELALDATTDASIESLRLPARPADPNDIVLLGDTGCRMVHWQQQYCYNGTNWPFAAVASRISKTLAPSRSRSIIIHVGDYHYREHPCSDNNPKCGGSPFGDNWATWEDEFFRPAEPLLLVAPWVMVRGNHEDCSRAGAGWLFFFALPGQRQKADACEHDIYNYKLNIGQTTDKRPRVLVVLDTANEKDSHTVTARCEMYSNWLKELERSKVEHWLVLHQPLWLRNTDGWQGDKPPTGEPCIDKVTASALGTIRYRFASAAPKRLAKLVISGDTHLYQFFQPHDPHNPIQIVTGNGGTALDDLHDLLPPETKDRPLSGKGRPKRQSAVDPQVKSFGVAGSALTIARHGFVLMQRDGAVWNVKQMDVAGNLVATCRFSESPGWRPSQPAPDCTLEPSKSAATEDRPTSNANN